MSLPKYDALFNPLLAAIKRLGGSASIAELDEEVIKNLNLTDEEIAQPHDYRISELQYRLAWARTHLKKFGLLNNSARGVWVLTPKGRDIESVDPHQVMQDAYGRKKNKKGKNNQAIDKEFEAVFDTETIEMAETVLEYKWQEELLERLLKLSPAAFERLSQLLLRVSGFVEVRVTGRSGDGGIDGVGIVRLGGLLGFPVLFQCKRYQGNVGPGIVRDFRGAMIGRSDRGLIITTGKFSREAKAEATRDGAPPIDLVDGEQLVDKLKELHLGVSVKKIEQVSVVPEFFDEI
ncbi:MAG TPA: restriction endonuclease [Ktedonobacteraceae bacterium]|nr:restriction endonuclease [Ktedonobacteraceae bacterium]